MVITSPRRAPTRVSPKFGPMFRRLLCSMAPAVRALVDGGNNVIFDHVPHDAAMHESCLRAFARLDVVRLGVACPIDVLKARKRARGDRVLGRARRLWDGVHGFCAYDLTVDADAMAPQACVAAVLAESAEGEPGDVLMGLAQRHLGEQLADAGGMLEAVA